MLKATITLTHMHLKKRSDPLAPPEKSKMDVVLEIDCTDVGACPHEVEAAELLKAVGFAIQNNLAVLFMSEGMALKIHPVLDKWLKDNGYKSMNAMMEDLKEGIVEESFPPAPFSGSNTVN